jgi:hypothetical protein
VDWIYLAYIDDELWAIMKLAMNLSVSNITWIFWPGRRQLACQDHCIMSLVPFSCLTFILWLFRRPSCCVTVVVELREVCPVSYTFHENFVLLCGAA